MNEILVIGISSVSFTGKDGSQVSGKTIYFTYTDDKTEGFRADKLFLSSDKFNTLHPEINKSYKIYYNRFGKPAMLEPIK